MRTRFYSWFGSIALFLLPSIGQANDSAAHLGAGGLEFTTTDAVVMEKENLYLSPELVKVDYVFRNITNALVELRVAFPLPRLDMLVVHGCSDVGIPYPDDENFLHFSTQVNGKPVRMEMQEKAFAGGKDITLLLKDMNVPIAELKGTLRERLKRLSPADQRRLTEAGALGEQEYCDDGPQPVWNAEVIYHWQQRFEPGTATRISHSYSPVVGSFFVSPDAKLFGPPDRMSPRDPDLTRFCVDEGAWRAIRKKASNVALVTGRNLEYILQTARSWKGPIRDFTLTIDKQDPQGIVSLCASGIKKIGPTTFQMKKPDFRPDDDLNVLFVDFGRSPGTKVQTEPVDKFDPMCSAYYQEEMKYKVGYNWQAAEQPFCSCMGGELKRNASALKDYLEDLTNPSSTSVYNDPFNITDVRNRCFKKARNTLKR